MTSPMNSAINDSSTWKKNNCTKVRLFSITYNKIHLPTDCGTVSGKKVEVTFYEGITANQEFVEFSYKVDMRTSMNLTVSTENKDGTKSETTVTGNFVEPDGENFHNCQVRPKVSLLVVFLLEWHVWYWYIFFFSVIRLFGNVHWS